MPDLKLRWIMEADGTRRLQYATKVSHGTGKPYWDWNDVPEVDHEVEYELERVE